jgi:hypothetical protein
LGTQKKRPEIRCRQIKSKLKALELLDDSVRENILGRIDKSTLQAINNTKEDQWVPIENNVEICECVSAEIGEKGYFNWSTKATAISINAMVVGPFFLSALNMLKIQRKTMIELAPQLWQSVFRNCGDMASADIGNDSINLVLKDLPSVMVGSQPCMVSTVAFIQGLMDFSGAKYTVALKEYSEKDRSAIIEISMDPVLEE